nr:MAG TPA: DNA polymerase II small subunit [Caudoviricetes sp.]
MENHLEELKEQTRKLQKAKYQLQTEKIEYNKWLRENARDELILEKIQEAISKLKPLEVPTTIPTSKTDKAYLLAFGDCHYGIEFSIKDFFGNIINEYSPEIFENRMWQLQQQVISIIEKENIKELSVWELGDSLQGILRLDSQLMKLKYGIIDSSVFYANFLAEWLNILSKYVRIKFQMVKDSNHNQLRICHAPKNAFVDENMSKVILSVIKERLKDNLNIEIIENPTGFNLSDMCGYHVLGIHGEVKDMARAINDFSRTYNYPLDYLIGGHVHHLKNEEVGVNCEALTVRSIVGVDPYGLSLNKTSNAAGSLYVFAQTKGKVCEYSLKVD